MGKKIPRLSREDEDLEIENLSIRCQRWGHLPWEDGTSRSCGALFVPAPGTLRGPYFFCRDVYVGCRVSYHGFSRAIPFSRLGMHVAFFGSFEALDSYQVGLVLLFVSSLRYSFFWLSARWFLWRLNIFLKS